MRAFNPQSIPKPPLQGLALLGLPPRFDLEIGAGQGLHAIQYCERHRDRTLVAVERTQRFQKLIARAVAHPGLENLRPVRADAIPFVAHFVAAESVERVFLLYPNPCPKPGQANQRWHRSPFMAFLKSKMVSNGILNLATNLKWYADEAAAWMTGVHGFQLLSFREVDPRQPGRTHFERKYSARGETCFDLVFEKGLQ